MKRAYFRSIVLSIGLYIIACHYTQAQILPVNREIDSVSHLLEKAREDTHKVRLLNRLARAYDQGGNPDQAVLHAKEALALSKELDYKKGLAVSLNIQGIFEMKKSRMEEAMEFIEQSLEVSKATDLKRQRAEALNSRGIVYQMQGNYEQSMASFLKAMELWKEMGNEWLIAASLNSIGTVYNLQGDHETALKYYLDALAAREALGDRKGMGIGYTNVGALLVQTKNYEQALDYLLKALELFKELGYKRKLANILSSIANVYKAQHKYDTSMIYCQRSLKLSKKLKQPRLIHKNLSGIADIYRRQKQYDRALEAYFELIGLYKQSGNQKELAGELAKISLTYLKKKDYEQAILYSHKALEANKDINEKVTIYSSYSFLARSYAALNKHKKAYMYHQRYIATKDSVFNEKKNRQIVDMQAKYETEQKERKLLEAEYETAKNEKQIALLQKDKQLLYASLGGFALLLILVLILFVNYRQKQKLKSIKNVLNGQETERKRISKELHDGVGGALASIRLNLMKLDEKKDAPLSSAIENISKTWEEVRAISHHLMPPALIDDSFVYALKKYIDDLIISTELNIQFDCYPEEEWDALEKDLQTELYRMVQEICNNIVKHAQASKVFVQMTHHHKGLNILIEDDGIGFDTEQAKGGIGLKNLRSRIRLLKGLFRIESQKGKGTVVNIEIPREKSPNIPH